MTSPSRILIVEDEASVAIALELIVAAGRFDEITVAENAEYAFDILGLAEDDPAVPPAVDVILLDVMMPGIDGIEACARIRKTRRYRDVPIIMCSGIEEVGSLNQAFIAGAHDYLAKPIKKIELLARIRSAMRFKRELDRRRAREAQLRSETPTTDAKGLHYIDANTRLPNERGFEIAISSALASGEPHGLLALQIVDADLHRAEAGAETADALTAEVARTIARQPAPLDWKLYAFDGGLFVVLGPFGTVDQLTALGESAAAAVAARQIVHGHSLDNDFARLTFLAARGQDTELLTLPAEIIRQLQSFGRAEALPNPDQMRAA